jgi:hypothetical protein
MREDFRFVMRPIYHSRAIGTIKPLPPAHEIRPCLQRTRYGHGQGRRLSVRFCFGGGDQGGQLNVKGVGDSFAEVKCRDRASPLHHEQMRPRHTGQRRELTL